MLQLDTSDETRVDAGKLQTLPPQTVQFTNWIIQ